MMDKKDIIDAEIVEKEKSQDQDEQTNQVDNNEEIVETEVVEQTAEDQSDSQMMDPNEEMPSGVRKVFTIDEATYLEYSNFVTKKRSIKTTLIMAAVIAIAVSFFFKTDNWIDTIKYMGIYAGFYLLIALGSSRLLTPRLMRNTYRKRAIGSISFDVLISETGMIQSFDEGRMKLGWSDFLAVQESEHSFFFTLANKRAILVPKNVYTNEELVEIRNILNRNLDESINQLKKFENE